MRLLLDTHVFVWAVTGSRSLKPASRRIIESADRVLVSAASIWEIAVKSRLGKIDADPAAMRDAIEESGFAELPVTGRHAAGVSALAVHHQDPFDRLLIAQAVSEPARLVTSDALLARYSDLVLLI